MFVACFVSWKIISSGVIYAADDIWWHALWLQDFIREINEGIIYPRWLAHSNYLYGSPTFVFYPPFCFYVGAVIQKLFMLSVLQTTTALFTLGTFASGMSLYLSIKSRMGKPAALAASIMLMTAPFITLDIYFRAALAELFSLIWLPMILLNVDNVQSRAGRNRLSVGFCLLALTHVPSLLIYTVTWLTRLLYCSLHFKSVDVESSKKVTDIAVDWSLVKLNFLYALLGLGCASFYLLPVLLEQRLVNISAILDRIPWQVNLLFSPEYKGFFPIPDIAIKSGITAFCLFAAILGTTKTKKNRSEIISGARYWFALNLATIFLVSSASTWLWQNIKLIQFLQFPWRLLTVNLFTTAMLFALCLRELPTAGVKSYLRILIGTLLVVFIFQNMSSDYFITKYRSGLDKPDAYMVMDSTALKVSEFARYEMPKLLTSEDGYPGVPEYTPIMHTTGNDTTPERLHPKPGLPLISFVEGAGSISVSSLKSYLHKFTTDSPSHLTFKMRTYNYPAWHLYMDGHQVELKTASDGQMLVTAPGGKHRFQLRYESTQAFLSGCVLSIFSVAALLWLNFRSRTIN
jgi:hypothetical protein